MSTRSLSCCCLSILFFVALRVLLGWHFLHEGLAHLEEKGWSSRGFLSASVGPFSSMAKRYIPDAHGWDSIMNKPYASKEEYVEARNWYKMVDKDDNPVEREKPKKDQKIDDPEHPFYKNKIYGNWAARIRTDWNADADRFIKYYQLDQDAAAKVKEVVRSSLLQLEDKLTGLEKDLFDYRSQLGRIEGMDKSSDHDIAFEKERIAKLRTENNGKPKPWLDDIQGLERMMFASMRENLAPEQTKAKAPFVAEIERDAPYKTVDKIVTWLLIIGGACLIFGLFTRTAAWVCGLFLLSVVMMQPFWISTAMNPKGFEQWVELFALFTVGTSTIGQYVGLDALVNRKLRNKEACCVKK